MVDLLTDLLPRLDRGTRALSTLVQVLADESGRWRRPVPAGPARDWLSGWTGSTVGARAARAALAVTAA